MSAMQAPADGDRNRGPQLVALYWTEGAIAILIVALRVYCRVTMRQMGLDDYMMLFTLALFLILAGFVTYYASIGGCRHLFYLTPTQQLLAVKYNWITQPWGIFGFGTGKISVALLILRILGPNIFWRKWILYVTMAVVFTTTSLACILTFVQCDPPRALWTPQLVAEHKATCWNPKAQSDYAIFFSCLNIFFDVLLAVLPMTIVQSLNMKKPVKIGLSFLLGLGFLAAICGIVKVNYLAGLNARSDLTWATFNLFAWSGAELFVIIICGSIPPIKPLFDHVVTGRKGSFSRSGLRPFYGSGKASKSPSKDSGTSDVSDQEVLTGDGVELGNRLAKGRNISKTVEYSVTC